MVDVEQVELNIILPDSGLGMVIMQPFVELCGHGPYRWPENDKKEKQIGRIIRTLEIAKQADHGCGKTHFTIFPEYSIPGLEGINTIEERLKDNSWENETIVIAGIDGLKKDDYCILCNDGDTKVHEGNRPEKIRGDEWVNCCITWAKENNGVVKRWIQPKLVAAGPEELSTIAHMFKGKAVYIFKPNISIQGTGLPFRFLSFICKDWIGNRGASNIVDEVLSLIDHKARKNPDRLDIYLCFILERNEDSNNLQFTQNVVRYITEDKCPSIRRSEGAVLFVNNAGKNVPGYCNYFGKSGFVFHPNCSFLTHKDYCPPTYSLEPRVGISPCKEARFRENGACITSYSFVPPIPVIVRRDPATPKVPIERAAVHCIDAPNGNTGGDPRIPGCEVPASVKRVNDWLDVIDTLAYNNGDILLKEVLNNKHKSVCAEIRKMKAEHLNIYVDKASSEIEENESKWTKFRSEKNHNPDNWDEKEEYALRNVVDVLSILKTCNQYQLEIITSPAHATLKTSDKVIDVVVVSGDSHNKCLNYAKKKYHGSGQRFTMVVTNDKRSLSLQENNIGSIYDAKDDTQSLNITDPNSTYYHRGYQNLVSVINSKNLDELVKKVPAIVGI